MPSPISNVLAAYAKGEKSAADEIYAHYYQIAWDAARKRIGTSIQSRVSPSDIVNPALKTALSRLADGRKQVKGSEEFKVWLLDIVSKRVKDAARRATAKFRSVHRTQSGVETADVPSRPDLSPDELAIANERIQQLMEKLVPDDPLDQFILLCLMQGRNASEMHQMLKANAKETGSKIIGPAAIRIRIARIRARLRELLEDEDQ